MTLILHMYFLLGTQLAMMMTHGAHLRQRLQELAASISALPTDVILLHYLPIINSPDVSTDKIDETSNTAAHQLTSIFEFFSTEETNEKNLVELSAAMIYESEEKSLIPEQYQPLLDLELFSAGAFSVSDTSLPADYYQDDYDQPATDYYQEHNTDDYYHSPSAYNGGDEAS